MPESNSIRRRNRKLADVLPPKVANLQANVCRTPGCPNYGVEPAALSGAIVGEDEVGRYRLQGPVGKSALRCCACERDFTLISNRALFFEYRRMVYGNDILLYPACPNPDCENALFPANVHPKRYYAHGSTSSGRERKRCRLCGATFTIGGDHRTWSRLGVNKPIILDLVNRASMNAILRKTGIGGKRLYERIDFIHRQMLAFERSRLRSLWESSRFKKQRFSLCTDLQGQMVNWPRHDRRDSIQLSCVSTADNLTGFVFRSDVNLDPTIENCGHHFEQLEEAGDFRAPEGLGLSARYPMETFLLSALWSLKDEEKPKTKARKNVPLPPAAERLEEIAKAKATILQRLKTLPKDESAPPSHGAVVKSSYTTLAHFMALSQTLPPKAILHLTTDADGAVVSSLLNGMRDRIKNGLADVTLVMFNKELKHPQKQARVAAFKKRLDEFALAHWPDINTANELRRAFIREFAERTGGPAGIEAEWWRIPIQTMYEPSKKVGIVYQRPMVDDERREEHLITLLDRSSLHAVDSFFNFLRQRVSYLHRPGLSRSSGTYYNAFQPYRGTMLQKIVDITRVYYNWVEPRLFRVEKRFDNVEKRVHQSSHELVEAVARQTRRSETREAASTPAMRLGLARGPVSLNTILYGDWRSRCFAASKTTKAEIH